MGRASKEFLALVKQICENYVGEYVQQKKAIVLSVLEQMKIIFQKVVNNSEYNFYALCSNMIDFGGEFKPYLLEANGCLKCFGKP